MEDLASTAVDDARIEPLTDWNLLKEMFGDCIEEEELSSIFSSSGCVLQDSINEALLLLQYYDSTVVDERNICLDPPINDSDAKPSQHEPLSLKADDWPSLPSNSIVQPLNQIKSSSESSSLFQSLETEFGSMLGSAAIEAAIKKSKNNKKKARNILLQQVITVNSKQADNHTSSLKSYASVTTASKLSPDAVPFMPKSSSSPSSSSAVLATGDIPSHSREYYLQEASEAYRRMKDSFVNAVYLRRNSTPSSGILKVHEGYEHKRRMREMASRAAAVVFQTNNPDYVVSFPSELDCEDEEAFLTACHVANRQGFGRRWRIDLHGLRVQEALGITRATVFSLQQDLENGRSVELQIITGRGMHSDKSIAKLQPTIETALKKLRYATRIIDCNIGLITTEIRLL